MTFIKQRNRNLGHIYIEHLNCILLQDDDSYILPVLLRFDGQPEVDEQVCTTFDLYLSDTNGTKLQDFEIFFLFFLYSKSDLCPGGHTVSVSIASKNSCFTEKW